MPWRSLCLSSNSFGALSSSSSCANQSTHESEETFMQETKTPSAEPQGSPLGQESSHTVLASDTNESLSQGCWKLDGHFISLAFLH